MIFKITTFRGHHEASVMEPEVSRQIFDKLTGLSQAALPAEFKTKVPDTFQELEALWKDGPMGYLGFAQQGTELTLTKEFDPTVEEMVFIAPQQGG